MYSSRLSSLVTSYDPVGTLKNGMKIRLGRLSACKRFKPNTLVIVPDDQLCHQIMELCMMPSNPLMLAA